MEVPKGIENIKLILWKQFLKINFGWPKSGFSSHFFFILIFSEISEAISSLKTYNYDQDREIPLYNISYIKNF